MEHLAVVDLGSNSFHLLIARLQDGDIVHVSRHRDPVRIGGGIDSAGNFSPEAMERALQSVEAIASRINDLPRPCHVMAVGTHAFRVAGNSQAFIRQASRLLGHPIEVISGTEEAALVYRGVTSREPVSPATRLVLDIGGGSSELVIGRGASLERVESFPLGCVSLTRKFLSQGYCDFGSMRAASEEVAEVLAGQLPAWRDLDWSEAYGSSGIIRSIEFLCRDPSMPQGTMRLQALQRLESTLVEKRDFIEFVDLGISLDRAQVICGGLVILRSMFELLDIEEMAYSDATLMDGLLERLQDISRGGQSASNQGR